jgi:hypothetical protein
VVHEPLAAVEKEKELKIVVCEDDDKLGVGIDEEGGEAGEQWDFHLMLSLISVAL